MTLLANSELVAAAWLVQRAGFTSGQVATTLPPDVDAWRAAGFVTVAALPGGLAEVDTPQWRRPVVQVDCWAAPVSSGGQRPQWNLAAQLAERVRAATEAQTYGSAVTTPTGYGGARVQAVYLTVEPRRVVDDVAGFARFTIDLAVDWVKV